MALQATTEDVAYADGFADALNDAAPDLVDAASAFLERQDVETRARLVFALAQVDLERAALP